MLASSLVNERDGVFRQPSTPVYSEQGSWCIDTMMPVDSIQIRPALLSDLNQLARLCEALWPESSAEKHAQELRLKLGGKAALVLTTPLIIFVAEANEGRLVGFLEVDLRSHADGCDPSRPVGYVEGWYVTEDHRECGVGRRLLAKAEDWARIHSCGEMASDALIDNERSQRAHEALGYEVVDRCVHYRKKL
jgi:aminoglycoside 6'-N-acetyltransferase I